MEMRTPRLPESPAPRTRGRPVGGGISAEQSIDGFLDAAERSLVSRGYRASTMEVIAREAGYSRGSIYRHFPSRGRLLDAVIQRRTRRHMARLPERQPEGAGLVSALVESMVIVATELVNDPLIRVISEQADSRSVAHMLANNAALTQTVEGLLAVLIAEDSGDQFRRDIRPRDVAQFLIATAMSMLLGVVPGTESPEIARRYIETFVLPAFVVSPPAPRAVFPDEDEPPADRPS
jgi:AcrR family transcriptional regulator